MYEIDQCRDGAFTGFMEHACLQQIWEFTNPEACQQPWASKFTSESYCYVRGVDWLLAYTGLSKMWRRSVMTGISQQKSFTKLLPSLQPNLSSALCDDIIIPQWDRHHSKHREYRGNKPYRALREVIWERKRERKGRSTISKKYTVRLWTTMGLNFLGPLTCGLFSIQYSTIQVFSLVIFLTFSLAYLTVRI